MENYKEKEQDTRYIKNEKWISAGNNWEVFARTIAKELYQDVEIHKKFSNNSISDIYIEKEKKIIECKLHIGEREIIASIIKYGKFCNELEIWSLSDVIYIFQMPRTIEINLNEFYSNVAKSKYSNICEKSYMDYIGKENNKNIRVTLKYYKDLLNEMKYNQYICGEMEKTYSQCYDKTDEKYEAIDLEKILKFEKVGYMEKLHKTDITYENICDENKIDQTDKYCHNSIPINYAIKNKITYSIKFRYYDDCKVNGKIKILRLQKMFIPTIQALISLPENLVNKEIIELIIYYTNNNDGDLYFGDLEHFYLTDNFNNKHDSIRYREMTKFFSDKDMASLYRHMEYNIIKKNSSKLVKLYFIIPKEAESRELYLEAKDLNIID